MAFEVFPLGVLGGGRASSLLRSAAFLKGFASGVEVFHGVNIS